MGKNTAIVENKEYVKTLAGEVLKIQDAPKHEDRILKTSKGNKKVAYGKGGVLMPNIESALSATHENRNSKDKLYTYKDEQIKIMPTEAKEIAKMLNLPIKLQKKGISPAKLLDLLSDKRDKTIKKYKDPINDRDNAERFNAIAANKAVLAQIPTKEDLYDMIFELQESKKSGPTYQELAQLGYSTTVAKNPSMSKFLLPKPQNTQAEKRLTDITKTGNSNIVRGQQNLEKYNLETEQGYVKDPNLLTIKDLKYNRRHNQSTPQTMVRDIARAAKVSGVPLDQALAIAQRETGLGSQTYHPQSVYSNWEQRHMGIPNSPNLDSGETLTEEELAKVKAYEKNSLKYPFASEMNTIKEKTKKFGLRGYNYGDPDYPNKVAQEIDILRNPANSKFMNYADSVYNATPKNYFDKKQTGGKLKKYM